MAIIGKDTNLPISFMSKALTAARGIGRILWEGGRFCSGGFLIPENLVVTCRGILPNFQTAQRASFQLDYYVKDDGSFSDSIQIPFDPQKYFTIITELDLTVVALRNMPGLDISDRCIQLFSSSDPAIGEGVSIIHYPGGEPLKISVLDGEMLQYDKESFIHTCPTVAGSSGAPIFNSNWQVIGVHHFGGMMTLKGETQKRLLNDAIRTSYLKDWLDKNPVGQKPPPLVTKNPIPQESKPAPPPPPVTQLEEDKEVRNSVFISYSHIDQEKTNWNDKLEKSLNSVVSIGMTRVWQDDRIKAGELWKDEIEAALKRTKVAVLLIGPEFLVSEFIRNDELPSLLQAAEKEGVRIIPVITHYCAYKHTTLNKFQSFNEPEKPLQGLQKSKADKLLQDLVDEIVKEY